MGLRVQRARGPFARRVFLLGALASCARRMGSLADLRAPSVDGVTLTGVQATDLQLRDGTWDGLELIRTRLERCRFEGMRFVGCRFSDSVFRDCTFRRCTFEDCELERFGIYAGDVEALSFHDCDGVEVTLSQLTGDSLTYRGGSLVDSGMDVVRVRQLSIEDTVLRSSTLESCVLSGARIASEETITDLALLDGELDRVEIATTSDIDGLLLAGCRCRGLRVRADRVERLDVSETVLSAQSALLTPVLSHVAMEKVTCRDLALAGVRLAGPWTLTEVDLSGVSGPVTYASDYRPDGVDVVSGPFPLQGLASE